jgi:hypothetical protein
MHYAFNYIGAQGFVCLTAFCHINRIVTAVCGLVLNHVVLRPCPSNLKFPSQDYLIHISFDNGARQLDDFYSILTETLSA